MPFWLQGKIAEGDLHVTGWIRGTFFGHFSRDGIVEVHLDDLVIAAAEEEHYF